MLFYLGYLTIVGENFGRPVLKVPNQMMKEIYADYFLSIINEETNLRVNESEYIQWNYRRDCIIWKNRLSYISNYMQIKPN